MKKILLAAGCSLLLQNYAFGQGVGINDDNSSPAPSAMLDVKSTNKGMLVPRMTTAQRTAIAAPATGLLVFDNTTNGFWYYNGTVWIQLVAGVDNDNQTMSLSGTTLNITGGNSVNLAGIDTDTDNQTMTLAGTTLSIARGNSVNLSGFTNTDNQTMTLAGTTLSIARGNSVNLSSLVNDADAVIGNEYNTGFALSGRNLQLTDGGGTRTVNLTSLVNDADAVIGNEYNTGFALSGTNLQLTDGGGTRTVSLAGLRDNLGNHDATTRLNMTNNNIVNVNNLSTRGADSYDKLRVWNSSNYTIGMNSAMTYGYLNDYAMTFTMNQDNDRGWIWRDFNDTKADGAMSLTTDGRLTVKNRTRLQSLAGTGNRMVIANATGELFTQAIPANGDITGVNAGNGLVGGGGAGTVTVNAVATNGLRTTANDIRLGGNLVENTTITAQTFAMNINLNNSGDFNIQDNGVNHFTVLDNGTTRFGGDVEWRDENTGGTLLAQLFDDGNDGRFIVRENGNVSVDLDANTQFIFNEQGLDRNFRVESDGNANMMFVDAGLNRVSIGTGATAGTFNVQGNSYHSDDIYLRDGAVNGGDVLVRIFDSADDGIIDVYENNARNHRIHGNGVTVFNEQGNNNADLRMESDNNANMFFLNAGTNRIGVGTGAPTEALHVVGGQRITTGAVIGQHTTYGTHLLTAATAADASVQIGAMAFNQAGSGSITFEENTPNYAVAGGPYCGFRINHDGATNTLNFGSACTGETIRMTLERGGDFGIATTNPTADLSVNGTANKTGGGNWAVFSDRRLKKNITNFEEGLSLITKVRTVNFSYNDKMAEIWGENPSTKDKIYQGVIAQELQEIAPDMVRTVYINEEQDPNSDDYVEGTEASDEEAFLEVDPNKFTYALINAVQEQQAIIDQLKKEQAATQKELAEIKALLLEMNKNK